MATKPCTLCEQREAVILASLCATGESTYVCLACLPPWTSAVWEASGLPSLTFDVDDQEAGEAEPEAVYVVADSAGPDWPSDQEWQEAATEIAEPEPSEAPQGPGALETAERLDGRVSLARNTQEGSKSRPKTNGATEREPAETSPVSYD